MSDTDDDETDAPQGDPEPMAKVSRTQLVQRSRTIAEEYRRHGLTLTVRQLYYQHVARGMLPSGQLHYKRVVAALAEARVRGEFPMNLIEDRGRDAGGGDILECEDDVHRAMDRGESSLRSYPEIFLKYARWQGQPKHVSVWVEKEALSGVFEAPCRELGVGFFACKGYPSVSSLHQWCRHVAKACATPGGTIGRDDEGRSQRQKGIAEEAVILYFGDHDPDGLEIPHSCLRTIEEMREYNVARSLPEIRLERVALTRDQIAEFNPPPFPAKETSARYAKYYRETGLDEAWELDALDPAVLDGLIRERVEAEFDEDIHARNEERIAKKRVLMRGRMCASGWVDRVMDASISEGDVKDGEVPDEEDDDAADEE